MKKSLCIILLSITGIMQGKTTIQEKKAQSFIDKSIEIQYSNPRQSAYYAQQAINAIKDEEKNDTKVKAMLALSTAQKYLEICKYQ